MLRNHTCGVVTWSEIRHNPNKFGLKDLTKETNCASPREWRPELPNCCPYTWIYIVETSSGQPVLWKKHVQSISLPVSVIILTVSSCQHFASGKMLIFKVLLVWMQAKMSDFNPELSSIFDIWSSCFETNLRVNVCSFIPVLNFIPEMRYDEVLLSMDWVGHFSMYHVTRRLLRLSFRIGRLRDVWNRLTCDGTAKDGYQWPQNESKRSKQME